jgi:peroxiredoxin
MTRNALALALLALAVTCGAQEPASRPAAPASDGEPTVKLRFLTSGAMPKMGGYMPQRLTLGAERPEGLVKAPEMSAPLYGVLTLGAKESPARMIVAVDEPEDGTFKLYVDANANGDLTDDPAPEWKSRKSKSQDGRELTSYSGGASVGMAAGAATRPVHLGMYRFDKNDPSRKTLTNFLFYYADYGYEGEIPLGEARYKAMLVDRLATGDFRGAEGLRGSGVMLMIDVNGNGRYDSKGESYDVRKPFNIKGTTYEVADLGASGAEFRIKKSDRTVAEVLPPPDLGVGQKAIRFTAKTTDGQEVSFPSAYAGKLVLLDFWATWCGPCIAELPHLTKGYEKFHDQGLEILGISLDQPNAGEKVASFTREKNMPWRQVYDGKYWSAEVANLYGVDSIPRAYLVDGDTGEIVATGSSLRGETLEATLAAALGKKGLLKKGEP